MQNSLEQYINKKSFWHAINPAIKILVTISLITIVFLPIGFFGLLITSFLVTLIWCLSKLPFRLYKSIFITWMVMLVFLGLINWVAYKTPGLNCYQYFTNGVLHSPMHVIFGDITKFDHTITVDPNEIKPETENIKYIKCIVGDIWGGKIDQFLHTGKPPLDINTWDFESITIKIPNGKPIILYLWYQTYWYTLSTKVIFNTLLVSFKIMLMITIITILLSTTSYSELTIGIEDMLHPLSYLRVPVNEWAMTFAIAIRFVPSLLVESQNILRAQASRGVDFKNGNFKSKVKSLVSLIIPMFSLAFHKADDLSNAMEARSYDPRKLRTRYRNYGICIKDFIALILVGTLFAFFIMFSAKHMVFGQFNWVEYLVI